jgi:leader peptidase (prepilin peptidase) / N-methyltransferase
VGEGGWTGRIVLAAIGLVIGGGAGMITRNLLRRLRRGVVLSFGPLEAVGALSAAIGLAVCWTRPSLGLVLFAGVLMVALGAVDLVHHRLPDAITLPALPLAAGLVLVTNRLAPQSGSLVRAALCAAALWAFFETVARISPTAMGRGDVKLAPTLGLLLGYLSVGAVVMGFGLSFVLGSVVALTGLVTGRLTLTSAIPLGPYLLLGCWSVLLLPVG